MNDMDAFRAQASVSVVACPEGGTWLLRGRFGLKETKWMKEYQMG
jgi:hypothetical protein